ncbi:MAG: TetR/AcrR family transcriptional regulator [Acidimicrobiia bacterium]|nr:TetR/AcrR family transcriptional regulator [Acidimicrobiia bacterium]
MSVAPPSSAPVKRAPPLPPDQRRAAIIDAALPLLIEHGTAVTTRQVAGAAGVSEGTIFNVFADKDELLAAALETAMDQAPFEQAIANLDPSAPFERRLILATELIQRRIVDIWRLLSQIGHHRHPSGHTRLPDSPALIALFSAERDRLRTDPQDAARLLRALTLALTHPMLAAEPRRAADIVDIFLHGNGVEP